MLKTVEVASLAAETLNSEVDQLKHGIIPS